MLINTSSCKGDATEFLKQRQQYGELAEDFLKRLKIFRLKLELLDGLMLIVFETGLIRNREYIKWQLLEKL
jgi:hypothetical protein